MENIKNKAEEILNGMKSTNSDSAKENAILVCDEVLNAIESIIGSEKYMWTTHEKETIDFWVAVKKHIIEIKF